MAKISRQLRKKTATIKEKKNGTMMFRFPMPDLAHARNALARLPQAKGLSSADKKKIITKACSMMSEGNAGRKQACMKRHMMGGKMA